MGRALRHHSSSRRQSKERENNWLPKLTLENLLALLLVVAIICFVIISSLNSVVDLTVAVIPQTKETVRISNKKRKLEVLNAPLSKNANNNEGSKYHLVFSTGCSPFQDWQSYVFFYHVLKSGQEGSVTRIASCGDPDDAKALRKLHDEEIRVMSDRFYLHITPEYSRSIVPGKNYKYYNKPFGMLDFMQNVLKYPTEESKKHDDTIILLLDPDQMIVRPFTNDFSNSTEVWRPSKSKLPKRTKVEHGSPFAQQYGFGMQWKTKVNATYVANGPTRVENMDVDEARGHYVLGPPYIATARDMYKITEKWTEFCPRVHDQYPHLLAEMFAYCFAAAHLNLPHRVAQSFMVSDPGAGGEGWKLVGQMKKDVCTPPPDILPHVLHYCQRYMLGKWFMNKYRLRKDFISCEAPLLKEPPPDINSKFDYQITPEGERREFKMKTGPDRQAFMLCNVIPRLNQAAAYYKENHCNGNGFLNKSYTFHSTDDGLENDME
mmetsp:Transcript_673/g.938  ORF Transcript_673/g.938 Transcript_673/m.938 type:complete len:491 (-) Transcript_673:55-1527(-)